MDDMSLISLATGPFSSLLLLGGMAIGAWRFSTTVVIPNVIRWIDEQQAQSREMLAQHEADRVAWLESMQECHEQGRAILRRIDDLSDRIAVVRQ